MRKAKSRIADLPRPNAHRGYRPVVVADYTGFSVHSIYRGCARGEIRHVRIGRAISIPGTEVLRLLGGLQ